MKKKNSATRKLVAAIAMLALSATSLFGSTYAWFTMNKEVSVTGMELKAHSEEGLLINEVKLATSSTWDDAAQAAATADITTFELRPTSTYDLATWWHANSKLSADEAGIDAKTDTVSVGDNGEIYTNLSTGTNAANDEIIVGAEDATGNGAKATGNVKAETHVYYTDASYGTAGSYQNGEGYYVRYTYYLKSSGQTDFVVSDLQAKVKATKKNTAGATDSTNLDPALRVGIAVPATSAANAAIAGRAIFSPVPSTNNDQPTNTSYKVTKDVKGDTDETVTPVVASAVGTYTNYQTLNLSANDTITIPKVTSDGIPVYVYVWFEGEDTHCMSDNLTAVLDTYDIDITFNNNNIGGSGTPAAQQP